MLSAFGTLLARFSGRDDLLLGTPVAARPRPELHDLIGCFADMVPVRLELTEARTFRELVRATRRRVLAAIERQDVPFDLLVDAVHPTRNVRTPLFQHLFVLRDVRPWLPDLPGIEAGRIDVGSSATRFDLTLALDENERDVSGHLEYAADLFEPVTIRRMVAAFDVLLRAAIEKPDALLESLDVLNDDARHALLDAGASIGNGAGDDRIDAMIARNIAENVAVDAGSSQLTYAELQRDANRLARQLVSRGVAPGDRVAVCLERSPELIVATLAIWKCGAAVVTLDPAHPIARRLSIADDAQARITIDHLDRSALADPDDAPLSIGPASVAALVYTSGSTGKPKGVLVRIALSAIWPPAWSMLSLSLRRPAPPALRARFRRSPRGNRAHAGRRRNALRRTARRAAPRPAAAAHAPPHARYSRAHRGVGPRRQRAGESARSPRGDDRRRGLSAGERESVVTRAAPPQCVRSDGNDGAGVVRRGWRRSADPRKGGGSRPSVRARRALAHRAVRGGRRSVHRRNRSG